MRHEVSFTVLGALRGRRDGVELNLGSPQQQAILASLLLHRGALVGRDELIDGLWSDEPPPAAWGTVRTYISRLRGLLGDLMRDEAFPGGAIGYGLAVSGYSLDLDELHDISDRAALAAAAGETDAARRHWRSAEALFSGSPLAGLPGPYVEAQRRRLSVMRSSVVEDRLAADLAAGRTADVLADLEPLISADPLHERLREFKLQALWVMGRQADALAAYEDARRTLADELGIDPGAALQELQRQILAGEAPPTPLCSANPPAETPTPVPAQLPAAPAVFVERLAETDWLEQALGLGASVPPRDAATLVTIGGMGGIGKTTAALEWAHQLAARYPDGQLFVDLRGFGPVGSPAAAHDVLLGFLESLGVPSTQIPDRTDDRVAYYRSLMSTRRMLVVLDNARDADQVRPLLPGGPHCLVLVTSRNPLAGLVATAGARPRSLGVFSPQQSRAYLSDRLGVERVAAEPTAGDRLVRLCAGLPLALAIVAARAALNPQFRLADLADEIDPAVPAVKAAATLDPASDLDAVFSWSYQTLSDGAAEVLRHLALHPGAHVSRSALASTTGLDQDHVSRHVAELVSAHLVAELRPAHYDMHDLVRTYAQSLTTDPLERRRVLERSVDHYVQVALGAVRVLSPNRPAVPLPDFASGVAAFDFAERDEALRWFGEEHDVLADVLREAHRHGLDAQVWTIAWALDGMQSVSGRWHDAVAHHQLALDSATRRGDEHWQGIIHQGLVVAFYRLEQHDQVVSHAEQAIVALEAVGDVRRLGDLYLMVAESWRTAGDPDEVDRWHRRAEAAYRTAGDLSGEAYLLNNRGDALLSSPGDGQSAEAALPMFARARDLLQQTDQPLPAAIVLANVARAYAGLGQDPAAVVVFEEAIAELEKCGEVSERSAAIIDLGLLHRRRGDEPAARRVWQLASDALADQDLTRGKPALERLRMRVQALLDGSGES